MYCFGLERSSDVGVIVTKRGGVVLFSSLKNQGSLAGSEMFTECSAIEMVF